MRLPEWLKRRKGKNPFEGSLIVDNPDIKVVEARYKKKPVLLAIGTAKQRELNVFGKGGAEGLQAKYETQKYLDWEVQYNPKIFSDFIPMKKAQDLMAGTIAVTSGDASVYGVETKYVPKEDIDFTRDYTMFWEKVIKKETQAKEKEEEKEKGKDKQT